MYKMYANAPPIQHGNKFPLSTKQSRARLSNHCISLFHRLGAGGKPPFGGPLDPGLELGPSDGAGAGRMGRFMMFWLELLEDVRAGYEGRGGAGAFTEPLAACILRSAEPLRSGGDRSRSFSFMVAAGAVGAR